MKKILNVDTPNVFARHVGAPELHPLLSIIHYDEVSPVHNSLNNYGVYGLFIQREFPSNLSYGTRPLQVSDASIIAVAPGQLGGGEDEGEELMISGWAILWSPELIHNTDLEPRMRDYHFFSYFYTESLRTEQSEWLFIDQLLSQMRQEVQSNDDTHVLRNVLLAYLRLLLEYCYRIYLRQFSEENKDTADILKRFTRCSKSITSRAGNTVWDCLPWPTVPLRWPIHRTILATCSVRTRGPPPSTIFTPTLST